MNKENKFKDLIGITGGIINSLEGVKEQSKQIIKSKITTKFKELNFVNREEFDEIKAMIVKAREKNTVLEKKIKYLENKIKKL
jgi:BMFP domain-containing protein YqiC